MARDNISAWVRSDFGGLVELPFSCGEPPIFGDLTREDSQLKKLVAELSLDNAILKEAAKGNS